MFYLPYLCLFAQSGVRYILTIYVTWSVSYMMQELLVLCGRLDSPPVYGRVRVKLLALCGRQDSPRVYGRVRVKLLALCGRQDSPPCLWQGPFCSSFQFSMLCFLFCLSPSCVLCTQCCEYLWIVHSRLPLHFSVTFISVNTFLLFCCKALYTIKADLCKPHVDTQQSITNYQLFQYYTYINTYPSLL